MRVIHRTFLAPVCLLVVTACGNAPEPEPIAPPVVIDMDAPVIGVSTIDRMLDELDQFRQSASFRRDGFRSGSRHEDWLDRIGEARTNAPNEGLRDALTMLEVLGLTYANDRGRETTRTRELRSGLLQARGAL